MFVRFKIVQKLKHCFSFVFFFVFLFCLILTYETDAMNVLHINETGLFLIPNGIIFYRPENHHYEDPVNRRRE